MVIDPWGRILAQQAEGKGIVMTELDMSVLEHARTRLPALQHRVF
jgi:nitrilase